MSVMALNACGSRISLIDWTRGKAMYTIMYSMRQNKTTCILARIFLHDRVVLKRTFVQYYWVFC